MPVCVWTYVNAVFLQQKVGGYRRREQWGGSCPPSACQCPLTLSDLQSTLTASSKKYLTCYLLVKCTFPEIVLPCEMWFLTMYTPTAEKLQYVKQIPPWSSVADHWWAPLPGVKMPTLGVWWNHPNLPPPIWLKHSSIFHTDHHHHLYTFHERTSVQTVNSSWNFPFKVVEYLMNVSEE